MGPVGQIVKILFYVFLSTELVISLAIYALSTVLLCSRLYLPEDILLHGSIALFLAIISLSNIHRGFQAVAHDCSYHLYWFAVYLVVVLIVQFLFEMFGVRETRALWYNTQSLPIDGLPSGKLDLDDNVENFIIEDTDKMAYRVPTNDEIAARKHKLYGKNNDIHATHKKHKWNKVNINPEEEREIELPLYPARKRHHYRSRPGSRSRYDYRGINEYEGEEDPLLNRRIRLNYPRTLEGNDTEEEKLTNTPLVLVLHGYSFILKMVCLVFSVLTGFLFQLEYI